jgi:hypothetical protein
MDYSLAATPRYYLHGLLEWAGQFSGTLRPAFIGRAFLFREPKHDR